MSFPLARFLCVLVRDSRAFGCAPFSFVMILGQTGSKVLCAFLQDPGWDKSQWQ